MKHLFAYIRVSDPKQGKGVSLTEQRSIIQAYADRIPAAIVEWFVETRTAAKAGRPLWNRMVTLLRARKAEGFIVHKLDRGTRNWFDWAEVNEMIDNGFDVHIAHENLDLRSRGGRLAADMEVVFSIDYIRNLREEALKGIHGRLKQGILPNGVGIGYLDRGAGNPKAIDPTKGPLVRRVFELDATGAYSLRDLTKEAEKIGLTNRNGRPLTKQEIHLILRNPFYAGIIRSRRFGLFPGVHVPLVSRALFDRVQAVLDGRAVRRTKRFTFLFRRFLHCKTCGRSLVGSERKGWIYYRCATIECPTTSVREDRVGQLVREELRRVTLAPDETILIEREIDRYSADQTALLAARRVSLTEALAAANARTSQLTDLLLDGKIDTSAHDEKRAVLLAERQRLEQELAPPDAADADLVARGRKIVELAKSPETLYESADPAQRRQLLEIVMSDCVVTGKTLEFSLREPFAAIANRRFPQTSGLIYDTDRTFSAETLMKWTSECSHSLADALESISLEEGVKPTPFTV